MPLFPAQPQLLLQATTGSSGFALQNGTPTVLSWTAPSDSGAHRAIIVASVYIASTETGGALHLSFTAPNGATSANYNLSSGSIAAGTYAPSIPAVPIEAGTTVSIVQGSALTGGSATVFAEIWAS